MAEYVYHSVTTLSGLAWRELLKMEDPTLLLQEQWGNDWFCKDLVTVLLRMLKERSKLFYNDLGIRVLGATSPGVTVLALPGLRLVVPAASPIGNKALAQSAKAYLGTLSDLKRDAWLKVNSVPILGRELVQRVCCEQDVRDFNINMGAYRYYQMRRRLVRKLLDGSISFFIGSGIAIILACSNGFDMIVTQGYERMSQQETKRERYYYVEIGLATFCFGLIFDAWCFGLIERGDVLFKGNVPSTRDKTFCHVEWDGKGCARPANIEEWFAMKMVKHLGE